MREAARVGRVVPCTLYVGARVAFRMIATYSLLLGAVAVGRGAYAPNPVRHSALWHRRSAAVPLMIAVPPRTLREEEDSHPAEELEPAATLPTPVPLLEPGPFRFSRALWRFSRPHTIIGSALCIPSLTAFAAPTGASLLSAPMWIGAAYALLPSLLMNVYIVGLNQLLDVDIDRVNKPALPLASGDLSIRSGIAICALSLLLSLLIGFAHPVYSTFALKATLVGSALLGTVYSLPPFRLKRFPLLAATCIMGVRGGLINWGFVAHAATLLLGTTAAAAAAGAGGAAATLRAFAPVAFFTAFGTVIALVKDVPDVKGDALFGIRSFSVRTSPSAVLKSATDFLSLTYAAVAATLGLGSLRAAADLAGLAAVRRAGIAAIAMLTALGVRRRAKAVAPDDSKEVYSFYMTLWRDFYTAYALLPFCR